MQIFWMKSNVRRLGISVSFAYAQTKSESEKEKAEEIDRKRAEVKKKEARNCENNVCREDVEIYVFCHFAKKLHCHLPLSSRLNCFFCCIQFFTGSLFFCQTGIGVYARAIFIFHRLKMPSCAEVESRSRRRARWRTSKRK